MNNLRLVSGRLGRPAAGRCFQSQRFAERNVISAQRSWPYFRIGFAASVASFVIYDGIRNEFTYCGASMRFLRSVKTASLIAVDYLLLERKAATVDEAEYDRLMKAVHKKSANRLLDTCLRNGGLYIKVGQGFAAINHILPKEYTETLMMLQDKCLPTTPKDVRKMFRQDFGKLPEEIFAEFDYNPMAAASLAQVFKAKLHSGEEVAVKVQYSDLQKRFHSDLGTIVFLQDIIEVFFKNYNFGWILHDVRKNLVQELNFESEGRNSERCARDLANFQFVHIPRVHWEYTKMGVLTMEWADGIKISNIDALHANNLNLRDIDVKLFQLFAEQIFRSGFVHADPHSGNIFVRRNAKTGKAELVLLDHGLYEELPEKVRLPLCEFWEATVLRDEGRMAAAARRIDVSDHMKFAEVLFQQPIRIHGGRIKTKLTEDDIQYMQMIARQNFDLIMETLRGMPRSMLFVVRNLNTVRAIGRHHGDVVDRTRVMARHAQRCLYVRYNSVSGYVRWLFRRMRFEYCLWSSSVKLNCIQLYLNVLYRLGRAPESAKTILRDMANQEAR